MTGRFRSWWEGLCRRCGRCCYEKEIRGGTTTVNWNAPCGHLDPKTRRCGVYAERFRTCRECRGMTVFHALFASYLPDDCGYVRAFRFWRRWTA